ncbi:hypothetical protein COH20_010907 [Aspergillus flavus]|nr:hypothetical protein COH20_010907 [Aspergillus flavus]
MDEYSSLYKEIQSLTALTSLIFQRPPDDIDYGELGNDKPSSKEPEQGPDEELDKLPDETDFEDDVTTGDPTVALVLLKQRSLDRLAEVLARFKTQKTGRHGRGKKKDAHLDAKHVTSVAMVEDSTLQRVTFLCAKNEGLKGEDEVFLERLCELLTSILKNGQTQTDQSEVFDLIFEHNTPRVEYYSGVIRDAFKRASGLKVPDTLTEDTIKDMVDQKLEARLWEGLIINIDGRQREGSQELIDCLSDKDLDKAVIETTRNNELRDFLESFYAIIRNPRQRPALKNLLKQALHGSEKLFTKAWDALLFLARTFHAAVTLVELASKLKLKLFNSFRFVPVSACMFKTKTYAPLGKELPLKVLEALPCQPEGNGWVKLLQDQRTINEYTNILRLPRSIHAEVQLMGYLETSLSKNNDQVFPYIGCSKKCCFFCEVFRALHEWLAPLMAKLAAFLRAMLRRVLSEPYPLPHRELCKQSSAALSTAQAEQQGESIYSESPSMFRNFLVPGAFSASDRQVQFSPMPGEPGFADFLAPSMPHVSNRLPIEQAEMYKINHDRKQCSLERIHEMQSPEATNSRLCRHCRRSAGSRCSACWTWYCSHACQRRDWKRHVFTCRTPKRPNDIDFFRLIVRHVKRAMMSENPETIRKSLLDLFADDYSCRTFGFNNCTSTREALCLVCLYDTMIAACRFPARVLNNYLKDGLLGEVLLFFCRLHIEQTGGQLECECIAWYLERRKIGPFPIPNLEGEIYSIWETAHDEALNSLDLYDRFNDGCRLNTAQAEVFKLFVTIRGSIYQIPDTNSSTWINFGFCYCTSFQQRQELSLKYSLLASSNASFDDIVSAYETSTMAELMTKHGIDLSDLSQKGVRLQRPSGMVYSVFRLMIGRWQLLNFYRHLFNLPEFDPRAMAAAKESPQRGALERYIDTLVPDMRRRIFDMDRARSILFSNFNAGSGVTIQGESEFRCALCGTSFNIARIRTINEPFSAAWSNEDPQHFVSALDEDDDKKYGDCSTAETGCVWAIRKCEDIRTGTDEQDAPEYRYLFFDMVDGQLPTVGQAVPMGEPLEEKAGRFGVRRVHLEHIAGPGCCSTLGYSGADISLEEMRGCQTGQGLVHNDSGDEEPSPDDLECEINSDYFLSGLVDCMPFPEVGGAGVSPARHQYDWIEPADPFDDWFEPYMAVPFHPWCFGVYMKLCKLRLGHVEINRLVDYFDNIESYPLQYREEPDPAVQKAADENWVHISGDEWLAANPFYVPKLREILGRAMDTGPSFSPQDGAFEPLISMDKNTSDPFARLPQEILDMIIDNLSTKDIASLRLVSRKFYQLHVSLWYRLIQEDMPWLWEVWSDEKPYFWATVTEGDIQQNKGETRIEFGEEKIMTHTINVDEHLAKWTMPIPAPRRTNWFLLYTDVKRHWSKLRGLWNRRRIWNYQQGLIASLKMHILSSDDHTA